MSSNSLTGKKTSGRTGEGDYLARDLWGTASTSSSDIEIDHDSFDDDIMSDELTSISPERPIKSNTQIRDLGDECYVLKEPVLITIEEYTDEEVYIAGWPEIEAFGEGVTETDAIANLKLEILDLFEDLTESNPSDLGAKPTAWLRILSKLIAAV